jgi:hypothetical protein
MSHFTRIKTKFASRELLLSALNDLECTVSTSERAVRGYGGRTTEVEVVVELGPRRKQIGFVKRGGTFECVADWYGTPKARREEFMRQLKQRYAYHATLDTLEEQGFTVVNEETVAQDQAIRLVLRRAV